MTVSSAKKVNAENICIELHWVAVGFALKTLLITTPWIHFQEASVRIACGSKGETKCWYNWILPKSTLSFFNKYVLIVLVAYIYSS